MQQWATAQGSLNVQSAVENNFSLQDVKDNWNRLTGGLLGVAASFGSAGEPILHPIDTWNGLKEFANADDKLAVLQMGLILTVEERNQDYETFVRLNDEFGRGMVIGRSVTDIASAISTISKTPALFKTALAQLRKTGHATINGVKVVYVSGKIARALDNYVAPVQIYKPVPAITQTAKKLPQGKGGQNTLVTRERVTSNIQETRRGNQSSQFGTHAQREWVLEQPVTANGQANSATYPALKNQLHEQNLSNIAQYDPRLSAAINGHGNFSMGNASKQDANKLGMIWVGDGAIKTSGGGWISKDGTRQYRPPTNKSSSFAITGVQANFETFNINPITGEKIKIKNGHLNIYE